MLFEHVLDDPHIEEFGTSGQGQKGIDLLGRRRSRGLDHWVGIQCKLTIKSEKLKAGEKGVVATEAAQALSISRGEDSWRDLATAQHIRHPNDENLARAAAEADIDQAATWVESNGRRPLLPDLRMRVEKAASLLDQAREKYARSEFAWDDYRTSLSINLAIGYRLLNWHDRAKQILETALAQPSAILFMMT